ncbi:hypothetical protein B0T16DRAFT_229932 [Cercophora newfieldiana]|uniref:Uncharacterized protein n=1 Tax=Cercophora newfieldiana TaxID=92897 RepID=A0AA39XR77_9PEZI|nr:hypothetical protein B0T16DRAFT_229932 [Cercophora newfieldiana]
MNPATFWAILVRWISLECPQQALLQARSVQKLGTQERVSKTHRTIPEASRRMPRKIGEGQRLGGATLVKAPTMAKQACVSCEHAPTTTSRQWPVDWKVGKRGFEPAQEQKPGCCSVQSRRVWRASRIGLAEDRRSKMLNSQAFGTVDKISTGGNEKHLAPGPPRASGFQAPGKPPRSNRILRDHL